MPTYFRAEGKVCECFCLWQALYLYPVFPYVGMFWIEEAVDERLFIGQQQQPLTVRVEAADRIHRWRQAKLGEGVPTGARFRRELGEHAIRLVQGKNHRVSVVAHREEEIIFPEIDT